MKLDHDENHILNGPKFQTRAYNWQKSPNTVPLPVVPVQPHHPKVLNRRRTNIVLFYICDDNNGS